MHETHRISRWQITIAAAAFAFTLAWLAAFAPTARAQSCADAETKVVSVQGPGEAKRAAAPEGRPAALNDVYCPANSTGVGGGGRADVVLANQTVTRLRENTTLVVEGVSEEKGYVLDLLQGA